MRTISREDLKEKIERGDRFDLYMTLDKHYFEQSHIPGSIHLENIAEVVANHSPEDEIIVYCSNPACPSSFNVYMTLSKLGCQNVYRYAGGLAEWQDAGYKLVGSLAN